MNELNEIPIKREIKKEGDLVFINLTYRLPKGKTTFMGKYPKRREDATCAYPERLDCNYGECYNRCEFMKCRKMGEWYCDAPSNIKK